MIPLFQMKILQFMFPQVVPDKEQKLLSMVHLHFGMVARSVKDEEKKAIKDEKEYQVGIDALNNRCKP